MAGNDWINSYLEAILDVDAGINDQKSSLLLRERGRFSPAQYFVEEVITGFNETDLHRSWVRIFHVSTMLAAGIINSELGGEEYKVGEYVLEDMALARKKKQIEGEEAQRRTKRHLEREKARREATTDMSEDLLEGEKRDTVSDLSAHGDTGSARGRMPRVSSIDMMANLASPHADKKLYIVLISLHGLIRGENMELGRDSDTGGQVKYVVELARALGSMPGVYRVDLLTRQVMAPNVDWTYGEPTEMLNPLNSENEFGESSGAYIIRIPFGPKDKYLSKEVLWPHIPEFVDGALGHILQMSKVLGKQIGSDQPLWPIAIHGHYADAGNSAALLSGVLNVPMIFTGHSLGRDKLEQLLRQGRQSREEINSTYKIMRRIEAEEMTLDVSEVIITSTKQEIEEQWRLYDGFDPVIERKLRARIRRNVSCYGRSMPRMVVIPPGMEFRNVIALDGDIDGELEGNGDSSGTPDPPIWSEVIMRFFSNPRKPMILALARPDPKKNLITLVKAFGECRQLRDLANLTLIMGNRDTIDDMSSTNSSVLLSILKLIDKYDLYGQVAYPKHHKQSDVPDIYRLAAKTKGVFINPAFIEPFGLTLIEAAARGLPIVATKNGGPVDIHRVLDNGVLVDPHDQQSIADALLKLVADKHLWSKCREHGLKNIHLFSWPEHCRTYLARITSCKQRHPKWQRSEDTGSESDSPGSSLRDIQDLSLKMSLDGERTEGSIGSLMLKSQESDRRKQQYSSPALKLLAPNNEPMEKPDNSRFPALRMRKLIFVIAVDSDSLADTLDNSKMIMEAMGKDNSQSVGFVLSTSWSMSEINSWLLEKAPELKSCYFDAFICNSGSEIYYPSASPDSESQYVVDSDYYSHIDYRWGGESLRNTLVPGFQELRRLMRIQALRCHAVYCSNGERINVIPVLASRAQAIRYLYVRWGMELSNVVVFLGESGDSDYEGLVGGLHKTVIVKGCGSRAAANQIHANRSYSLEDVVPKDDPKSAECHLDGIRDTLHKLGLLN
ncbi:sucrose-phosphate synthase [Striga asiatica]|uniref:Sucrose-phosphate synthase n=1 Tax=Striga asiatica TaxID=4170 RepID=A0A5A7PGY8_STRAF|nr:sucrose-phosphate synthase [Striga asiatica]